MSDPREYHGHVTDDGKIVFDSAFAWTGRVRGLRGKRVVCTVEPEQQRRSLQANRRYWGLLVPIAGQLLCQTRHVPLSKKQVHYVLASAFAGTEDTPLGQAPVETHVFTTAQFHDYCTRIEVWLTENGWTVPAPGELMEASL